MNPANSARASAIAAKVEAFVRNVVVPFERDPRRDLHGAPTDDLIDELKQLARGAGVLTPHILPDGSHLTQRETALVLMQSGLSPLGPLACNTAAPDEGNMYLLGKVATPSLKQRFLTPLVEGRARSAFFMTEPAEDGGAGSDPSMMKTTAIRDANYWTVNGRKACRRAHDIASDYANRREAFGKTLIDHEGVGFMVAENLIELQQAELMIGWCADVLDAGSQAIPESSMTKVAVSEALMRVADRCVQVMGGSGLTEDTIVEQIFREVRAFRIYDGPTETHKWALAKKIKRDWKARH